MNLQFADRVQRTKFQENMDEPLGTISFASSRPASDLFPVEDAKIAANEAFVRWEKIALQYAPNAGIPSLRTKISERVNKNSLIKSTPDEVCITTGSQQALDIIGKLMLNNGDVVLCEVPVPTSIIMAFANYGARFVDVASDEEGMITEDLEIILRRERNIKIIYVCPDFMRTSGKSWSEERRKRFIEIVSEFDVLVVEDRSYSALRYEGSEIPAVASFDTNGQVLVVGSYSRVFCPGIRVGWIITPKELFNAICDVKRATDISSSSLDQCVFDSYMDNFDIDMHIQKLLNSYRKKRDLLYNTMQENCPKVLSFEKPEGGSFIWVNLNQPIDTYKLLEKCIELSVSFLPASRFFPNGGGENMLRLSFSSLPMERIRPGVQRIVRGLEAFGLYASTRVTVKPTSYLEIK